MVKSKFHQPQWRLDAEYLTKEVNQWMKELTLQIHNFKIVVRILAYMVMSTANLTINDIIWQIDWIILVILQLVLFLRLSQIQLNINLIKEMLRCD